jgi:uncharacterized protein YigE (DUF2233 family)
MDQTEEWINPKIVPKSNIVPRKSNFTQLINSKFASQSGPMLANTRESSKFY